MAAFVFGGAAISSDIAAAAGGTASSYTYTLVTEPDQGLTPIYNLIATAKKTIDMTMYEFTDTTGEQLLAQAAAAGVSGARHPGSEPGKEHKPAGVQLPLAKRCTGSLGESRLCRHTPENHHGGWRRPPRS